MPHRVALNFFRHSTSSFENQVINLKKSTIRSRTKSPNRITNSNTTSTRPCRSAERIPSYASSIEEDMDEPSPAALSDNSTPPTPAAAAATPATTTTPTATPPPPPAPAGGVITAPAGRSPAHSPRLRPKDAHDHKDKDKDHHHHRLSFPGLHLGRSHKDHHSNPHAHISWKIESPPIIFHGDAANSTGALVSGQLFLDVKDDAYEIESFAATLNVHVTQKKPFTVHCPDCVNQYTEVKKWNFLPAPGLALQRGVHPFPFSVLLDGHLPASLDSPLVSIAYEFKAEAVPVRPAGAAPIRLDKVFDVKRSLPPPELPHHSVRVFPPTNVKASVHYQQVIHPIGTNTLTMRLDGIAKATSPSASTSAVPAAGAGAAGTVEYWKLKKLTWRLEETLKTVAPACDKHRPASTPADGDQQPPARRGMARTETRVIGEKTLFSGWKSSYGGPTDSHVELELEYALSRHARYSCDLSARDGTEVSHQLMLEMVVSQECAPAGRPGLVTQTGVGRILRMHFGTVLTERGGIGISWDNEAPPIYQDVPPSPPAYHCEDLGGSGGGAGAGGRGVEGLPDIMESLDGHRPPPAAVGGNNACGSGSGYASGRSSGRNSPSGHR